MVKLEAWVKARETISILVFQELGARPLGLRGIWKQLTLDACGPEGGACGPEGTCLPGPMKKSRPDGWF